MKHFILVVSAVLLALQYAEGRPEQPQPHHPPMVSQHETVVTVTSANTTEPSISHETTMDSVERDSTSLVDWKGPRLRLKPGQGIFIIFGADEDDNITVQAKTAPMCPPRQPEIVEIEKECMTEDKLKDSECTAVPPTTEEYDMASEDPTTETTTTETEEETTIIPTTDSITTETSIKHVRRHRKRTCNYHLCILRRLDVLDSSDMPNKDLLTSWAANNITDINQKESTQEKLKECIASLKDIFVDTSDSSKSSEEDTQTEYKADESPMNRKRRSCTAAKKVIGCLSKSAECPVVKF